MLLGEKYNKSIHSVVNGVTVIIFIFLMLALLSAIRPDEGRDISASFIAKFPGWHTGIGVTNCHHIEGF